MSIRFDHCLMERDAAAKGWTGTRLAARAGLAQMTVSRFFRGQPVRPDSAKKLARALGQPIERYMVASAEAVAS